VTIGAPDASKAVTWVYTLDKPGQAVDQRRVQMRRQQRTGTQRVDGICDTRSRQLAMNEAPELPDQPRIVQGAVTEFRLERVVLSPETLFPAILRREPILPSCICRSHTSRSAR